MVKERKEIMKETYLNKMMQSETYIAFDQPLFNYLCALLVVTFHSFVSLVPPVAFALNN